MQIGLLGLGRMGRGIADKLMLDGHRVVVWNRSKEILDNLRAEKSDFILKQNLIITRSIEELSDALRKPRVLWVMLPAGEVTNGVLGEVKEVVETGDIVIDGANSYYKDTERWAGEFEAKGVKFLGIGVSGGIHGLSNGFPLMVGGTADAYDYVKPILDSLIKPYGIHTYFGAGGAGHFVKMVHNGIEYGMMQSLAEGFGVLAKSNYRVNLLDASRTWQGGSIVASFLLDMAVSALSKDPSLSEFTGVVDATGEAKWTIEAAKEENVPITIIEQSLEFRTKSQYDKVIQDTFAAKLLSALRKEFGGHEQKKAEEPKK
jgi:6-phosphogluconate dehydrogenase